MERNDGIVKDMRGLKRRLGRFLARYGDCIGTAPSRRHVQTYVAGQVGPLERKNVENIALDRDVKPRTLQSFMETLCWDEAAVARRNRRILRKDHFDENAIGVIDETSFAKKGRETIGVKRQHCGASGKIDNCVVSVHLAYVSGDFAALADSDLYLPDEEWCAKPARRAVAGIPDAIRFRTKLEIALDLLDRTLGEGVPMKWLAADEFYGRAAKFRHGVAERGLTYVFEIPCNLCGWTPSRLAKGRDAVRVDELWKRGGPSWRMFHVKNTEKGPLVWEVRAARFHVREGGAAGGEQWLLLARNFITGEKKYFLSNAPESTPVETLLHVAFRRWHVERLFEDAKGQVGMDHFEMRRYAAVMRHLILTMTSVLFLMRETARLRKKRLVEPAAGPCIHRVAA